MTAKVAIISSYKTRCGVASYAETIESLLDQDFDLEVLPLDQFILRHRHPRVQKLAWEEIDNIGRRLKEFDTINLQWEPGLLGSGGLQVVRRTRALFKYMVSAKKPIIISAHTVLVASEIDWGPTRFVKSLLAYGYSWSTNNLLRWLDQRADLTVVTHTPRDRSFFQHVVGIKKVVDHPLSLLREGWPARIEKDAPDYRRKLDQQVGSHKKIIGTFGFLTDYKGLEVAVRAMREMPDDYVLLIYGQVHGENMKPWQPVDQYIAKLMKESLGKTDTLKKMLFSTPLTSESSSNSSGVAQINSALRSELLRRQRSIADRVFFMGSPDDYEFALAVKAVDVCVFPYLEVGQSASGPVAQAIELGKKTALSRTKTFTELETYFPDSISFFEIGNYMQLAQTIKDLASRDAVAPRLDYDQASLRRFYSYLFTGGVQASTVGAAS